MRLPFILSVLVSGWLAMSSAALASNCAMDEYDHNGSVMEGIVCDGGAFNISYVTPRRGIFNEGVRSGTILFQGTEGAGGTISGTARVFSNRCGVIGYTVSGHRFADGNIVLNGQAPKRNNACQVIGYKNDRLVFNLIGGVPTPGGGGPAVVPPSCPPGYIFDGSACVVGQGQAGVTPGGSWYAIAGSFPSQNAAIARRNQLGGSWFVMNTVDCPNFRNGFWVATVGPLSRADAQAWANSASHFGANIKSCY